MGRIVSSLATSSSCGREVVWSLAVAASLAHVGRCPPSGPASAHCMPEHQHKCVVHTSRVGSC